MYVKQFTKTATTSASTTDNIMLIRDWRKALRAPPSYRIISSRQFRYHFYFALTIAALGSLFLLFFYIRPATRSGRSTVADSFIRSSAPAMLAFPSQSYNYTYPLTEPIFTHGIQQYRIGLISDLDKESRHPKHKYTWRSFYLKGRLGYARASETITISFDGTQPTELTHSYAYKGRGMELSELTTFNGRLLTFDDRTGLVYELANDNVVPWVLLMDGNGRTGKGFKSEWATVKDQRLYVGSMGKEWTTSEGDYQNYDPMYVKVINVDGEVSVYTAQHLRLAAFKFRRRRRSSIMAFSHFNRIQVQHLNWMDNYKAIRAPLNIQWPGYMIHESAMWSDHHNRWFFLPRRCSKEKYNETRDEMMGCNVLLSASEDFANVQMTKVCRLPYALRLPLNLS